MSLPLYTVEVGFGLSNDGDFILGSSLLGGTDVLASGFNPVSSDAELVTIRRGRWSQVTDVIDAGDASVQVLNMDRAFDPRHAASPYFGRIRPGLPVRVRARAVEYLVDEFGNQIVDEFGLPILASEGAQRPLMTGPADGVEFEYDVGGRSVAIFRVTDVLGELGAGEFDAWTSSDVTAPGKLAAICRRPEVGLATSATSFGDGAEALQVDNVSHGSNVLNYAQLIARSELGYLFAAADGTLTYRNRNVTAGAPTAAAFGGTSGIPFQQVSARFGDFLFSRVSVDREGGTQQTVQVTDLDDWRRNVGGIPRTLSLGGLLLATDTQSLDLAEFLLLQYSAPRYEVAEIAVELAPLSFAQQDTVLTLDITDLVSVEFTPNGVGDPITQTLMVQGVGHDVSPGSHVVRLSLIAVPLNVFVLGSSLLGGDDVLAF